METFIKVCFTFLSMMIIFGSRAQQKTLRPTLFGGVQSTVSYPKAELEKIFTKTQGSKYHVTLPGNFNFTGTIVSQVKRADSLTSFLIKSEALKGAIFAISKQINQDKSVSYAGRIVNENYSDGYELKADAGGNYFLNKINMDGLLPRSP